MNQEPETNGPGGSAPAEPIQIKVNRRTIFARGTATFDGWPHAKKHSQVLCEMAGAAADTIRVCPECLRAGNIDERLEKTAQIYERWAAKPARKVYRLGASYAQEECERRGFDYSFGHLDRRSKR